MGADGRGWGAPIPYGDGRIVGLTVRGCPFPGGVHRRVHPIMASLVAEYFDRVAGPNPPYAWGHAYRKISGSDSWSNHAWGLAVDIRNDLFPQFTDNMTAAQKRDSRDIAARHGCRWGGDYSAGNLDQMHFEYMGTPGEADDLARRLESQESEPIMSLIINIYSTTDTEVGSGDAHYPQFETEHVDADNKHGDNWRSVRVTESGYYFVSIESGVSGADKNVRLGLSEHDGQLPVRDDTMTGGLKAGQTIRDPYGWTLDTFSRPVHLKNHKHYAVRVENRGSEPVTLTRCQLMITKMG